MRFGAGRRGNAKTMIAEGELAPGYHAPTNKGQTLSHESFVERVPVVLFFLDGLDGADDQLELDTFDDLLVEFGHRRVQLLGVAPTTPRVLRDATGTRAVTVLADEDGAIRERFGGGGGPFAVVIDRTGIVAGVVQRHSSEHPNEVLGEVDRLLAREPARMQPYEPVHDEPDPDEKGT
jgi:peroxiredoxin